MHAIRFHLRAPDDTPGVEQPPTPEALRAGLARALGGAARIDHARILVGPGTVDGVVFVLADHLLAAEAAVITGCANLTGPGSLLPGWRVPHCAVDTLLALGL
ncbi:hypothetical protein ACGF07_13550 [Kitasatospora sp. NPDC048194]|uniref:hypothetical protein n=1 Tax=Kitasatospora sp. NPDC048194 TaxID=3364045 RepID=UPI003713C890